MKKQMQKLAVLASGSGTTLQAVIDAISNNVLDAEIKIVISDNNNAYALKRAENAGIKTYILSAKSAQERDQELYDILKDSDIDLVVLLGYLKLVGPKTVANFTVINTHPALLPKYGGKGMHGMHVHQAVVDNKETESGVTLHFIDEEYDKGRNIWQTHVPVYEEDTADDVSERVQRAEKAQIVSLLKAFSEGKIDIPEK